MNERLSSVARNSPVTQVGLLASDDSDNAQPSDATLHVEGDIQTDLMDIDCPLIPAYSNVEDRAFKTTFGRESLEGLGSWLLDDAPWSIVNSRNKGSQLQRLGAQSDSHRQDVGDDFPTTHDASPRSVVWISTQTYDWRQAASRDMQSPDEQTMAILTDPKQTFNFNMEVDETCQADGVDHETSLSILSADASGSLISVTSSTQPEILICDESGCSAEFSGRYRKGNLGRHKRNKHTVSTPTGYICEDDLCPRTFQRKDARLNHYRNHHPHLAVAAMPRSQRHDC